jgi:hypothetical protein
MSKPTRIGEMDIAGAKLPVFASAVLIDRVLCVDPGYTGDDDTSYRVGRLLAEVSECVEAGKSEFGHEVRDRTWVGDPEKIECDRINIGVSFGARAIILGFSVKKILKRDPRFNEIAAAALRNMQSYEARRDV